MDEPVQSSPTSEPQVLGGNIELHGFHALDGGTMIVLKKIIGNYARRFSDQYGSEKLTLRITPGAGLFALNGTVRWKGNDVIVNHTDKNVFFLVDAVLKKLETGITSS